MKRYHASETDLGVAIPVGWKLIVDKADNLWFVKEQPKTKVEQKAEMA